jgi:hypothetical protein
MQNIREMFEWLVTIIIVGVKSLIILLWIVFFIWLVLYVVFG